MILNTLSLTPEVHKQGIEMAEAIFETHSHPDQMQTSEATFEKLKALNPNSILYQVDGDKLLGWAVTMPTSRDLMRKFLDKEITEQGLLDLSKPEERYFAAYICAVATMPESRRKGIATNLVKEALARLPLSPDCDIFAWPTSEEGKKLVKKIESETGKVIHIRT